MIILDKKPLSISEVKSQVSNLEEKKALEDYLKRFGNLKKDKAEKLAEDLRSLNNPKIKEDDIVKVIDFLPTQSEEVNKIFTDVSLSEDESNKIIEIVGKY